MHLVQSGLTDGVSGHAESRRYDGGEQEEHRADVSSWANLCVGVDTRHKQSERWHQVTYLAGHVMGVGECPVDGIPSLCPSLYSARKDNSFFFLSFTANPSR